mgnify:CR=1 FL=1
MPVKIERLGKILEKSSLSQAASIMSHAGSRKGGYARAKKLSPAERHRIAVLGGKKRHQKRPNSGS